MLEKTLQAGNIAAAFAIVATAADLTFASGAATAISAALSTVALVKKSDKMVKAQAKSMAKEMQAYFDNSAISDGRKKITAQMLGLFSPSETDLATGNMDAGTIATNMRTHIADTASDPAHKTTTALTDYADALAATLGPALVAQNQAEAMLQELLQRSDQTGELNRLNGEGISETAIIRLAQRIARGTDDLGQAWLTLQDAMDTAVMVQREGHTPSNHGDFVNQVLARVADLAADGEYSDASRAIDAALAEQDAENERRKTRLLQSGVRVARLDGDAVRIANLLLQQADLDAGGTADLDALRSLLRGYYETGRDKAFALDLEIAIELARLAQNRANSPDQHSTALNDLGIALKALGARESGVARLEQAVVAHREALKEYTRDKVPLGWAMTQGNLGGVYIAWFDRTNDPARLDTAQTHVQDALEVFKISAPHYVRMAQVQLQLIAQRR